MSITDKALAMRELRAEYRQIEVLLRRMVEAIDPNPRYQYRKAGLSGVLRHVIFILDESFPDWRDREKISQARVMQHHQPPEAIALDWDGELN